ncbi:MAG: energy transducer TonB [Prolixibacteraceae bacterium]|nr:energy transducer TonB [Prolixibacteraceae bacterium]
MRIALITILILGRVIQTYSQDIELITKQTKNPNSTEKYFVLKSDENIKQGLYEIRRYDNSLATRGYYSKNKKDSTWIFYASNGIDTTSIGCFTDDKPTRTWTVFEEQCRVRYKFDYSKYDVVKYNWYETPNIFPILIDTAWIVSNIDSPPLIIGKENPFQLISGSLRYPIGAHEKGISGQVLISFIVDKDGKACDFKVLKGVAKDIDAEAIRVTKMLDKNWFPAKKDGQAITIEYCISINFRLI